ncbi:hypothetical protein LTS14_001231 [Recurvomyces mirabilis]|uniref:uncharacterized protein n=1 Tax=Recurvomyces mirabilis TaxID=574656 RepID=UPI002DE19041|nr:hypothetical protein LTS14_001231 [Recurvomyces mirabilis]
MAAAAGPTTTVEIVDYSTVHATSTIYVAPASTTSSGSSTENLGHAQPYGEFPTHQMICLAGFLVLSVGANLLSCMLLQVFHWAILQSGHIQRARLY